MPLRAVGASLWSVRSCDRENNVYRVTTMIISTTKFSFKNGILYF